MTLRTLSHKTSVDKPEPITPHRRQLEHVKRVNARRKRRKHRPVLIKVKPECNSFGSENKESAQIESTIDDLPAHHNVNARYD